MPLFFIGKEIEKGASIYYEDLIGNRFVNFHKTRAFIRELVIHHFKKKELIEPLIDIDLVINVESGKKKLNIARIKRSPIDYYVKISDMSDYCEKFIDGKEHTLKVLKASAAMTPFYPHCVDIGGKAGVDGGSITENDILDVIKNDKSKKIIYVGNEPLTNSNVAKMRIKQFIWACSLGFFIGPKIFVNKIKEIPEIGSYKKLIDTDNFYMVVNDLDYSIFCTDKRKLMKLYQHGITKGEEVLKLI